MRDLMASMLESLCMLLPKALKMRTIKDTMALVADSIGGISILPCSTGKEWAPTGHGFNMPYTK